MKLISKILAGILSLQLAVGTVLAVSACDKTESDGNVNGETGGNVNETDELAMEKKYYLSGCVKSGAGVKDNPIYFLFHENGTGEYVYHNDYVSSVSSEYNSSMHYKVRFKYGFADKDHSAVLCFYDDVDYLSGNVDGEVYSDWKRFLTVSENFLMTVTSSGYTYYINEDFLGQIPNYGS